MGRARRVLAVCADEALGARVLQGVVQAGIEVCQVKSAEQALRSAEEQAPDLVVIDALLPDVSGLGLCRLLREHPRLRGTPILMLSPYRAEIDRVLAFEAEVDDYLPSEFSPRELASRVRAILRRSRADGGGFPAGPDEGPRDLPSGSAALPTVQGLLTQREQEILAALVRANGTVLSRDRILSEVWGSGEMGARVVDAHVKNIRRKLGASGARLETVRGLGYRFRES
jgi:two-component system phosphate regulon response regulator PhoB